MGQWVTAMKIFIFIALFLNFGFVSIHGALWRDRRYNTCSGTQYGFNVLQHHVSKIEHLRELYENCKIVEGNLEISHITQTDLDIAGGPEALNFLSSIEQVHGYVLIVLNQVTAISLPSLQIIWGDFLYKPIFDNGNSSMVAQIGGSYSLFVMDNPNLEILDLKSLRAVHLGHIGLHLNPYICHWQTLDYRQFLGDDHLDRIKIFSNFKLCDDRNKPTTCWQGCKSCFGPSDSQCQKIYRDNCADQCPKQMCYNTSSLSSKFCCHAQCAGGCFGPNDTQCYGCSLMKNGNKCVDKCPPHSVYNPGSTQFEKAPDGLYSYMRLCVEHCPSHLFTWEEKDACVSRCPEHNYNDNRRFCMPCNGPCPKTCHIKTPITALNIRDFENCTEVIGAIHIGRFSFEHGSHYPPNDKRVEYKGITYEDLELLSNIQVVSDYVIIESESYLKDLNFLRNLRIIEGRRTFRDKISLQIFGNDELEYLGLVNLKEIMHGEVWIKDNFDLCYVYDIPWHEIASKNVVVKYESNRAAILCNESLAICDPTCESMKGCWGPGAKMCYECKDWKLNNKTCVENCTAEEGFYESKPKVCESCHSQCLTCNGSKASDCFQCRNASLDGVCVPHCPTDTHFFNQRTKVCQKCHENCFSFGCTGPGNFVGEGGCKKCRYGIYDDVKRTVSPCLFKISQDHCSAEESRSNFFWATPNNPLYGPMIEHGVCVKCSNVCKRCSALGHREDVHNCVCTSHRIFPSGSTLFAECGTSCPSTHYGNVSSMDPTIIDCYPCHSQCVKCHGPTSSDCESCRNVFVRESEEIVNCMASCSEDLPFRLIDNSCALVDEDKEAVKERKQYNMVVVIVMSTIFLALIAVCIAAFLFRRRNMMLTKLNIPDESYEMNIDAKPDLSQLRLITELELKRGGVIGYGAFGTVFKGVWTAQDSQKTKLPVAIKVLHEAHTAAQQDMLDEASHMARVNHPYLLKLIGVCLGQQMMLITPLMPLGNLLDYVQQNRAKIGSSALLRWCAQIASGMAHLEELRLVHRDLAARNVLVQNPYRIKITDFGLAKMLDYGEQELKIVEGKMPIKWLALECIQYRRYTHKSDVWAYGVTVWELLTFGEKPYKEVQLMQIPHLLDKGERLSQPKICTLDVYMILIKCWMVDADCRPSFKELHETFNKMSKDPGRYLVIEGDKLLRLPSYSTQEQRNMMRELFDDPDIVDLDEYLDDLQLPSSPTSPLSPNKPLMSEVEVLPRNGQRLQSTTSHRYAADPLKAKNMNTLTMDLDNYLVSDSQSVPPTTSNSPSYPTVTYTPVITGNKIPDCISKHTYYNELPMANGHPKTGRESSDAENFEYLLPNSAKLINSDSVKKRRLNYDKSDEIIQNETVL